jgi:cell division inhibitor SepF
MASFMNKALAYLGLKDVEDDELYEDDYATDDRTYRNGGRGHTVYPDNDGDEVESHASHPGPAVLRPVARDEPREAVATRPAAVLRPIAAPRPSNVKPQVVTPERFADAQEIGDLVKANSPVIVNLQMSERDLARRMIDFCSGVTYALGGSMEKVADHVFLLTPSNVEVSAEDRERLHERGLFEP